MHLCVCILKHTHILICMQPIYFYILSNDNRIIDMNV